MSATSAARVAGLLYVIQMATAVFGEVFVRGRLIARGDPAKTAENIMGAERLFRLSVAGDLLTYVAVIALTWCLYVVLRRVDENVALLGVLFRLAENAVLCVATVNSLAVLRLLSGAESLKAIEPSQRQALASLAIAVQGLGMSVGFILCGLGSAVFAYLLLRSRYVPSALAGLGIFGSLVLALVTLAGIVFPGLRAAAGMAYMAPMGLYEVGLGLWLLFKGIRTTGSERPA